MMDDDVGRAPSGQALVSDEARSGLHPPGFDPSRVDDAVAVASTAHRGQRDKAGKPYILHPLRLMARFESPVLQCVAVLHDVVEDSTYDLTDINRIFGFKVAAAVDALTRREGETYSAFIERCRQNPIACSVKIVDLQDNMDLSRLPAVTEADHRRNMKYARALEKLTASAIEARRAETAQHGSVGDESAGPKDDAQPNEGDAQNDPR